MLFTSGATGPPKGVVYRHAQLRAQLELVRAVCGITPEDRLVAAFAPFALYGPALGIGAAVPRMDVTRPGHADSQRARRSGRSGRGNARLRLAGRAAQRGRHRESADRQRTRTARSESDWCFRLGRPWRVPLLRDLQRLASRS